MTRSRKRKPMAMVTWARQFLPEARQKEYRMKVRMRTLAALGAGFGLGFIAGSAAGREPFDRIRAGAMNIGTMVGLMELRKHAEKDATRMTRTSAELARDILASADDLAEARLTHIRKGMKRR